MGKRETESGRKGREEIADWLEEMAAQLRTGTLMVDGRTQTIPEQARARIKSTSKDGSRRLRLDLEWSEKKDSKKGESGKKSKKSKKAKKNVAAPVHETALPEEAETDDLDGGSRLGTAEDRKRPGVRDHDSHVLVCTGGDCSKKGGKETRKALKSELRAEGMNADVRVDSVGCLGLCKQGPNVIVYPEGSWYLGLKERDVPDLVQEHLKHGEPVERLTAERRPRKKKAKR